MKRILVTGAGGYIGRHVVRALAQYPDVAVIAVDVNDAGIDDSAGNVQKVCANIFAPDDQLYERLGRPDACIHLAWRDGFVHNSPLHMEQLSDHIRFIHRMTDSGVKQIAVMGTMHEVGYWEGPIDEDTPCNPSSQYGIAKDAMRRALYQWYQGKDVSVLWLRAYYIFGDDKKSSSIFGKLQQAAERGQTEFPFTTGKNKYDFIRVEELGQQLAACIHQDTETGIINCCTGKPVSLAEQIEQYIRDQQLPIKLAYGKFPDRPYDSPGVWGDASRIEKIMQNEKG